MRGQGHVRVGGATAVQVDELVARLDPFASDEFEVDVRFALPARVALPAVFEGAGPFDSAGPAALAGPFERADLAVRRAVRRGATQPSGTET